MTVLSFEDMKKYQLQLVLGMNASVCFKIGKLNALLTILSERQAKVRLLGNLRATPINTIKTSQKLLVGRLGLAAHILFPLSTNEYKDNDTQHRASKNKNTETEEIRNR